MEELLMAWHCKLWCWTSLLMAIAVPAARADELIRNGKFEQGQKDFQTKFKHSPGNILEPPSYDIVKNASDAHRDAPSFGDHSSGKDYMMIFNGNTDAAVNATVWEQTVEVRPESEY